MGRAFGRNLMWATATAVLAVAMSDSAAAQTADDQPAPAAEPSGGGQEIVVTARRRDETLMAVPVAASVVTTDELERRGVMNIDAIARVTPQLSVANSSGSIQGGALGLRGISAGEANALGDQAVAFNVDGVQVARASVRRMGEFDLQQVEVLRGPQALFFGKNSPAGIVVLHSADPGPNFEAGVKLGYEFNAKQVRGEAFVSGPLSSTLGARLAVYGSDMEGWVDNVTPDNGPYTPADRTAPSEREYGGRITLKFDSGNGFDARLKAAYGSVRSGGIYENVQRVRCPLGTPQLGFGTNDDCVANNTVVGAAFGPNFQTLDPIFGDGQQTGKQDQAVIGLEANYELTDALTLSSQTSYYHSSFFTRANINANSGDSPAALARLAASVNRLKIRETGQELRLSSDFDGPFDFLVGAFYQDTAISYTQVTARTASAPTFAGLPTPSVADQDGKAYSVFGQATFDIVPELELSGGARYSHEKKRFSPTAYLTGAPIPTVVTEKSWSDVSPEVTLTYRPSRALTIYGGYKEGFLSGGFNGGTGNLSLNRVYDQQRVEGFEGGVKAMALDNALRIEATVFSYKISGQQVSSFVGVDQFITNAGASRSEGVELNFDLRLPSGFSARGGVAYNDAHYTRYAGAPCFAGQTPTQGCTLAGGIASQDLSGQRVVRAPEWAGYAGLGYDVAVGDAAKLSLSLDANYNSKIFTDGANNPFAAQNGYWLLDGAIRLKLDSGLELSAIGRNLTNEYYYQRSIDNVFTGSGTGTAAGVRGDTVASVSRGREFMVQIGYKFK